MDNHHPELDYGLSDFDVDQRFVASYVYDLPFGRGKKLLGGVNRAANLLIGGWETNRHRHLPDRVPVQYRCERYRRSAEQPFPACERCSGLQHSRQPDAGSQRINPACFTQPALGTYGDTTRNFLRQPGINNWDMGVGKNLFHRRTVQIRATRGYVQHFQPSPIRR